MNHTGRTHSWVSDPKYYDWFHHEGTISDWNDQTNVENGDQDGLPDFNQDNPEVKRYLLDMTKWWIEQTDADGLRLDTYRHVPVSFWTEFINLTKSIKEDFYSVGEVFDGSIFQLADYQTGTGADGMLDYPIYSAVKEVFGLPESSAATLGEVITQSYNTYDNAHRMGTFIDNHDVPRFINALQVGSEQDRTDKLKQALTFMMTYTGIPILYYGTEIAMDGGADPDNRHDMDWNARTEVTDFFKKLTGIRKSNPSLTYGDIAVLRAEQDFLCFERNYEGRKVVVAFNNTKNKVSYEVKLIETDLGADAQYHDILGGKQFEARKGSVVFDLKPYQSVIIPVGDKEVK